MANIDNVEFYVGKLERKKSKIPDLHSNFNEAPAGSTIGVQRTGTTRLHTFIDSSITASNRVDVYLEEQLKIEHSNLFKVEALSILLPEVWR